jgi:hypothetical protein
MNAAFGFRLVAFFLVAIRFGSFGWFPSVATVPHRRRNENLMVVPLFYLRVKAGNLPLKKAVA